MFMASKTRSCNMRYSRPRGAEPLYNYQYTLCSLTLADGDCLWLVIRFLALGAGERDRDGAEYLPVIADMLKKVDSFVKMDDSNAM